MATVDDKKIIFSMVGVSKTIQQNQKQVLKNIYLSFFYGAKIGIIGLNGAGKSTLMKIIAGLDQQYQGNVVWSPGYTVGYLPQDPPLNEEKTVKENVMEGVQHVYDALAEYDEINVKFGLCCISVIVENNTGVCAVDSVSLFFTACVRVINRSYCDFKINTCTIGNKQELDICRCGCFVFT